MFGAKRSLFLVEVQPPGQVGKHSTGKIGEFRGSKPAKVGLDYGCKWNVCIELVGNDGNI